MKFYPNKGSVKGYCHNCQSSTSITYQDGINLCADCYALIYKKRTITFDIDEMIENLVKQVYGCDERSILNLFLDRKVRLTEKVTVGLDND